MHVDPALPLVGVFGANDPSEDERSQRGSSEPPSTPWRGAAHRR